MSWRTTKSLYRLYTEALKRCKRTEGPVLRRQTPPLPPTPATKRSPRERCGWGLTLPRQALPRTSPVLPGGTLPAPTAAWRERPAPPPVTRALLKTPDFRQEAAPAQLDPPPIKGSRCERCPLHCVPRAPSRTRSPSAGATSTKASWESADRRGRPDTAQKARQVDVGRPSRTDPRAREHQPPRAEKPDLAPCPSSHDMRV